MSELEALRWAEAWAAESPSRVVSVAFIRSATSDRHRWHAAIHLACGPSARLFREATGDRLVDALVGLRAAVEAKK